MGSHSSKEMHTIDKPVDPEIQVQHLMKLSHTLPQSILWLIYFLLIQMPRGWLQLWYCIGWSECINSWDGCRGKWITFDSEIEVTGKGIEEEGHTLFYQARRWKNRRQMTWTIFCQQVWMPFTRKVARNAGWIWSPGCWRGTDRSMKWVSNLTRQPREGRGHGWRWCQIQWRGYCRGDEFKSALSSMGWNQRTEIWITQTPKGCTKSIWFVWFPHQSGQLCQEKLFKM